MTVPGNRVSARQLRERLKALADPVQAVQLQRFFKTAPGQYGYGDRFWGIKVPALRELAKACQGLPLGEVARLLEGPMHEERMVALLILTCRYPKAAAAEQRRIYEFYLAHTHRINNWDLVDATAPPIVGAHLADRAPAPLYRLARSRNLWERRIAMVATIWFIRRMRFEVSLRIAAILRDDPHDLIHKAAGWMLREVGKRDPAALDGFLGEHYLRMPRTMLRYAIERLPEPKRQAYLKGRV